MFRHPFFILLFITIVIVGLLHLFGLEFSLYWRFWWFDLVVHFLGGAWVSGIALWLLFLSGVVRTGTVHGLFILIGAALFGLLIGLLWELFEIIINESLRAEPTFVSDTITDLIADTSGAFLVGWYFIFKRYNVHI